MRSHFRQDVTGAVQAAGGEALRRLARFPRLMVPAGPPTRCTSLPSQPISLFLASNEAINELYRSLKLSLELDG